MSRFGKFLGKLSGSEQPSAEQLNEEQIAKEEQDAIKEEKRLSQVLDMVHKLYQEYKLVGSVDASRTFALCTTSISCEIDGNETFESELDHESHAGGSDEDMFQKAVKSSVTRSINSMINRAKAYKKKPFKDNLTIANSVSISGPVLGLFSIYVSCSATISSLIAAGEK